VEAAAPGRVVVPVVGRAPAAPAVACGIRAEAGAEAVPAEEVGPGVEPAAPVIPVGLAVGAVADLAVEADLVAVVLVAPARLVGLVVVVVAPAGVGVGAGAEDMEVDLAPAPAEPQVGKARLLENGGRRQPCCTPAEPEGRAA
jgi:hypothetical protein